MRSAEIRERFLRFFEERGHHRLPSFSLIPHDDPSLLFTVAGMVPLKPWITGQRTPPAPDLVSCQKCFRGAGLKYDDISSVGDPTHHTFFEMLGNWSIGHYFKEGAIDYAWEFCTDVLGLEPERLWPSIYPDDVDSERLWVEKIGVPRARIARLTENWWAAGPTGPCGYDSELYFDWGGPCSCGRTDCTPQDECDGDRWEEFWNLVFMEFDQQPDGSRPKLPKPTVDTGLGFDRIVAIVQGDRTGYATDHFTPMVEGFRSRARAAVSEPAAVRSLYVLADHLRGAGFLIAAGVLPSNEGRGYVLRRLIRRADVHARRVAVAGGLAAGTPDLVAVMGPVYPELVEHQALIEETLRIEEDAFARTLDAGTERLAALLARSGNRIDGADAFRLYDTFGLPIELTVEMAAERGARVDLEGFEASMREPGDALHGFVRSSYGSPQSNGCVEMTYANAALVWPLTPIGTLVTVVGPDLGVAPPPTTTTTAPPAPRPCRRRASSATTRSRPKPRCSASASIVKPRPLARETMGSCFSTSHPSTRSRGDRWATPGPCTGRAAARW